MAGGAQGLSARGRRAFQERQLVDGALAHGRPRIAEQFRQHSVERCPGDSPPSRILDRRRPFAHAINGAEDIGFPELGRWATKFIPSARVDDEQAAIRVFQDAVGWKSVIVRNEEIFVLGFESCAVGGRGRAV